MSLIDTVPADVLAGMVRQYEVEQFLYAEAALLDAHDYDAWIQLFTDDTFYFMPIRRTRMTRDLDAEFTKPGQIAWFCETKELLSGRVDKLKTGRSWSEDPPSRTRHLVTNVRVVADDGTEMSVHSNFHLYRTRLRSEETSWIGSRQDVLRRTDEGLRIAKRTILLEQTVLLARNMSNFF